MYTSSSRQASRCSSHGTHEAPEQMLDEDGQAEQAFPGGVVIHAGSLAGSPGIRIRAFLGNMRGNGASMDDFRSRVGSLELPAVNRQYAERTNRTGGLWRRIPRSTGRASTVHFPLRSRPREP